MGRVRTCIQASGGMWEVRYHGGNYGQHFGLQTILPSPIVYGVCHTKGGSVGGCISRNSRAVVVQ